MSMGFFDSVKDWASKKLASTEFVNYVEQATSETLLSPNYDMFMVLVDAANDAKGEWVSDVVRSVRVRLDCPNPKVKLFTLELVSVLIQNCGLKLHSEVADSKGLLNGIVENACLRQDLVRGPLGEARKAAIQLIVNLDVWFKHHPAQEKVKPLAELINDAKSRNAVFENVIPDTTTNIITDKYPRRPGSDTHRSGNEIMHANSGVPHHAPIQGAQDHAVPHSSSRGNSNSNSNSRAAVRHLAGTRRGAYADRPVRDEVVIVESIPCEEPNEERRSGMFEAVMLLGEVFHTAQQGNENIRENEMVSTLAQQIQEDFLLVSMLVNSGAVLESADVLGSLYESQRTVLRQVREATGPIGSSSTGGGAGNGNSSNQQQQQAQPPATGSSIVTGGTKTIVAPPPPPPAKKQAPTLDELFASSSNTTTGPSAPAQQQQQQYDHNTNHSINTDGKDVVFSSPNSPSFPGNVATSIVNADGTPGTARRRALPDPSQNLRHGQRNAPAVNAELVEMNNEQELHSPKEGSEPSPNNNNNGSTGPSRSNPTGAPRTAADVGEENGSDFDAFLNSRLGGN